MRKGAGGVAHWTQAEDATLRGALLSLQKMLPGRSVSALLVRANRLVEADRQTGEREW